MVGVAVVVVLGTISISVMSVIACIASPNLSVVNGPNNGVFVINEGRVK